MIMFPPWFEIPTSPECIVGRPANPRQASHGRALDVDIRGPLPDDTVRRSARLKATMFAVETEQRIGDAEPWRTVDHARNWIARMDREEGTRDEELWTLVSFLGFDTSSSMSSKLQTERGHGRQPGRALR